MATPLMEQYLKVKEQHKDSILLYRMGDFYELFDDDAVTASKVLGLTLTSRNNGASGKTPLAGFPYHSVEKHLPKLIKAGYKVAICEQTEDPAQAKGIVKREVTEVITKGTTINENCLDSKSNNFIASLYVMADIYGLAYLDITTAHFCVMEGSANEVLDEMLRIGVQELLIHSEEKLAKVEEFCLQEKILLTPLESHFFNKADSKEQLLKQFKIHSLEAFGCDNMAVALVAAAATIMYVTENKKSSLDHILSLKPRFFNQQMNLDGATIRNLELIHPLHDDDPEGTLFNLLDETVTAMGGRKLKYWLTHPLRDLQKISQRQIAIGELIENRNLLKALRSHLREINDIERILSRVGAKRANARDLLGLSRSLIQASQLAGHLGQLVSPLFSAAREKLLPLGDMGLELQENFVENPPLTIREGNILNPEKHPQLKAILEGAIQGKKWLSSLEETVKTETGISSLKVGFNKVFGYYIEVSKQNVNKVPENFIRKQTLVNGERFITPEMKEWEAKILSSEGESNKLQYNLFCEIRDSVSTQTSMLLDVSNTLAAVDVLCALAQIAIKQNYICPQLNDESAIIIKDGRHPVVEKLTEEGKYIPNDVDTNTSSRQILLITGPNMAGKSTYLRQVALITLMAQMGSYVSAKEATIGMVDRIFTRVGASDRLARGQSTFMVEMIETASILNNATNKSLILLDEIGRGTSTFDGLSLAWAIVEALHNKSKIAAKTLFATHYHELTQLEEDLERVINIHVAVKEVDQKVIFLRKILEGACDSSYGIQVAGMAGIPQDILKRAWDILSDLEKNKQHHHVSGHKAEEIPNPFQQNLFATAPEPDPKYKKLYDEISKLELAKLTPIELMVKISELQKAL